MTALTAPQVREVLERYEPDACLPVMRRFLEKESSDQEWILRSHSVKEILYRHEDEVRKNLDQLLGMASALEVITIATGELPATDKDVEEELGEVLRNRAVERFYSVHYPLALPILIRHQLDARSDPRSVAWKPVRQARSQPTNVVAALLLSFFELEARLRRSRDLQLFFDLLDDRVISGFSMPDLLDLLEDPGQLEQLLDLSPSERGIEARALNGLNQFMIFCTDLDALCERCEEQPMLQGAIWLHFCYWFGNSGSTVRETAATLRERLKKLAAKRASDADAAVFLERIDSFVELLNKLTNWKRYAGTMVTASRPLLDGWESVQTPRPHRDERPEAAKVVVRRSGWSLAPVHPRFEDAVRAVAAADADPAVIAEIVNKQGMLPEFGIASPIKIAHFLAQISHESGGFKIAIENMNYSAKRMTEVWKKRFPTLASAEPYAHNPEKLGNFVYANRMGNGAPESGDGFRYRGRGLIQMTGKDMYAQVGKIADLDLVGYPELAEHPEHALPIAAAVWNLKKVHLLPEGASVAKHTALINGGDIGLLGREERYKTIAKAMGIAI